jgi:hypothetical protein
MTATRMADVSARWFWRNFYWIAPLIYLYGYWRGSK